MRAYDIMELIDLMPLTDGGYAIVPRQQCDAESCGRQCQLDAGHDCAHSCWSMGAIVSWFTPSANPNQEPK